MPRFAAANGDGDVGDSAVTTEVTPDTPITDADVQEFATSLGINEDTARQRLELERASVGFEPRLIAAFPETFGGAWLETEGEPGLTVAVTNDAETARATIQSMFAVPEAVSTITVEHSLAELLLLQEEMIRDRTALQLGKSSLDRLDVTGGHYDLDIDVKRNTVVVRLREPRTDLVEALTSVYGTEMLVIEGNASAPEVCTRSDCRYTLRGGLRVISGSFACSSAFSAKSPNNYYLISAAHCDPNDNARYNGGERYGTVTLRVLQGRVDAERHYRPYPSPWGTSWYVSASIFVASTDMRPVRYHISWDSTMIGTYVGKAGAVTNTTRGDIFSKYLSPDGVPGSNRFLGAEYCGNPGDSGGAVFNTNTAYGVHHGGPEDEFGFARVCGDPLDYGIFGNIVYAKDALGLDILAAP